MDPNGNKKAAKLAEIDNAGNAHPKFNECFVNIPAKRISSVLREIGVSKITAHLNVSPNSKIWAHSSTRQRFGTPSIRRAFTWAASLEASAAHRKPGVMPSAVEITLHDAAKRVEDVVTPISEIVNSEWPAMASSPNFGTIDFGDDWLFFPASGYNPMVSEIFAFFEADLMEWPQWRQIHNISFEILEPRGFPQVTLHSLEKRSSPTVRPPRYPERSCGGGP